MLSMRYKKIACVFNKFVIYKLQVTCWHPKNATMKKNIGAIIGFKQTDVFHSVMFIFSAYIGVAFIQNNTKKDEYSEFVSPQYLTTTVRNIFTLAVKVC